MGAKDLVICLPTLKSAKIIKWKVEEGTIVYEGRVILLYDVNLSEGYSEQKKLKATEVGTVRKLLVKEGEVVDPGGPLLELERGCSHPTVMNDLCAECGADLRKQDTIFAQASVPMVHSVPELKVSEEQAQILGRADEDRLLQDRKLVLLVDLDQTIIHTTNDIIPNNLKDIYHFQLYGPYSPWYHTRLRPGTHQFLSEISQYYELHICTFGARNYAHTIARFLDPDGKFFSHRILSRDECFNPNSKMANLKALFPCGDELVCIIDDREDVWNFAPNLIHVKPYHFFQHTGDIHAPPGLTKNENDEKEGYDFAKFAQGTTIKQIAQENTTVRENSNKRDDSSESELEEGELRTLRLNSIIDETDKEDSGKDIDNVNIDEDEVMKNERVDIDNEHSNKIVQIINEPISEVVKEHKEIVCTEVKEMDTEDIKEHKETASTNIKEHKETVSTDVKEIDNEDINELKETAIIDVKEHKEIDNEDINERKETANTDVKEYIEIDNEDINEHKETASTDVKEHKEIDNEDINEHKETASTDVKEIDSDDINEHKETVSTDIKEHKEKPSTDVKRKDIIKLIETKQLLDMKRIIENELLNELHSGANEALCKPPEISNFEKGKKTNMNSVNPNEMEVEESDDYLMYLEEILIKIHKHFYDLYDKKEGGIADLKQVIPAVREKTLAGTKLVFSGLVPRHLKLEESKPFNIACGLGAKVTQDLEKDMTHLVAVRSGTAKVNAVRKMKNVKMVTPDWLWVCAERWEHVSEELFPIGCERAGSRHPPPHCASPPHTVTHGTPAPRLRTPSGRFMDTINPLMSFSSEDIADMDAEVEDIFNESESEGEGKSRKRRRQPPLVESEESSSSSADSLAGDHVRGWGRKRPREETRTDDDDDESISTRFRRGGGLPSDIELGEGSGNSVGSDEPPDEISDGEWNMMGATLEREFLEGD